MAELNFPTVDNQGNPIQAGAQYTGSNGVTYIYDGVKWDGYSPETLAGSNSLVNSGNTVQVDVSGNFVLPNYTFPVTTGTDGQTLVWPSSGTLLEWATGNTGQWSFNGDTAYNATGNGLYIQTNQGSGDGSIYLPYENEGANLNIRNDSGAGIELSINGATNWTFGENGDLTFPNGTVLGTLEGPGTTGLLAPLDTEFLIETSNGDSNAWSFRPDGRLALPGGEPTIYSSDNADITLSTPNDITLNNTNGAWIFGGDGRLELPGDLPAYHTPVKRTSVNSTATNAVVFEYPLDHHTAKLILQVEGYETDNSNWETQSCEMIIAKSFKNNKVAASVYGLVHTSDAPLATFDAQYNAITNTIQVTCTPTATVLLGYPVYVVAYGTTVYTSDY